jgi:hypothetical protein
MKASGRRVLVSFGAGLVSTALGIAVDASGLKGDMLEAVAWSAVGVGIFLLTLGTAGIAAHAYRRRRSKRASRNTTVSLGERVAAVGQETLSFLDMRIAEMPRAGPTDACPVRHPMRASRERHDRALARAAHARDTVEIYHHQFGPEVRELVRLLLNSHCVAENEARILLGPESLREIDTVARRLIEIAKFVGRNSRRAA